MDRNCLASLCEHFANSNWSCKRDHLSHFEALIIRDLHVNSLLPQPNAIKVVGSFITALVAFRPFPVLNKYKYITRNYTCIMLVLLK